MSTDPLKLVTPGGSVGGGPDPSVVDPPVVKRILYCGPDRDTYAALLVGMGATAGVQLQDELLSGGQGTVTVVRHPRATLRWLPVHTLEAAQRVLDTTFLNMIIIDLRWIEDQAEQETRIDKARELLRRLDEVEDVEGRFGFHRILVLVSGPDGQRIDDLLVELGGAGIRHVLKQRSFRAQETVQQFAGRLLDQTLDLTLAPRSARTALCAAGGGITAIFFEVGVLKCLDDCLVGGSVNDFDMYFGISAGAVVTSLLANGFAAEEFMAALAGVEDNRIRPVDLSLVRLGHLNLADMRWRVGVAARSAARVAAGTLFGRRKTNLDSLFLGATSLVGAPFKSDHYEAVLREILQTPGATNHFGRLRRPLYIGATNQDTRRHVLWGDQDHLDVPVSKAVQASLSINPAFASVEIDGSWYEDGAVTRTSNFGQAIKRGADLIIVLDPFVPYFSKERGLSTRRGMLYNIDQDIRSLSYTRYELARKHALRRNPEVRSYTLLPNNRLRRLLSDNPMDHRVYLEVFRGSYLAALHRIQSVRHLLDGDLSHHGLALDTGPAESIAARLEAAGDHLSFADFFVDGRVELRRPRLSLQRPARLARVS